MRVHVPAVGGASSKCFRLPVRVAFASESSGFRSEQIQEKKKTVFSPKSVLIFFSSGKGGGRGRFPPTGGGRTSVHRVCVATTSSLRKIYAGKMQRRRRPRGERQQKEGK